MMKPINSCLRPGAEEGWTGTRKFFLMVGGDGNVLYIDGASGYAGHVYLSKLKLCTLNG